MKKYLLFALTLIAIVALGIVTYMFTNGLPPPTHFPAAIQEKLAVRNAFVNGSTVSLDVLSIKGNITFIDLLIIKSSGDTVDKIPISDSLLEGQSKIISANFDKTLTSGNYIVYLRTTKDTSASPSFYVP
jgi:hypothetical protein